MSSNNEVVVVGGGLVGSLLSTLLSEKYGFKVTLYERRSDPRITTSEDRGRSINLSLSCRGITALEKVGLSEEILKIGIPMRGRMIHEKDGRQNYHSYSSSGKDAIYSVSRSEFNKVLLHRAERSGVTMKFNTKIEHVDYKTAELIFKDGRKKAELVFGADGAYSVVRNSFLNSPLFDYSQIYSSHGYKELYIPPGPNGTYLLDANCLHLWPRGTYMLIALPNLDGSFTVTFFFPFKASKNGHGFDTLATPEEVEAFFKDQFPDVVSHMPTLKQDFFSNPSASLLTVKCFPWSFVNGKTALVGDAAHAIVPFFGQGMNCGFEDVSFLDDILQQQSNPPNWEKVLSIYQTERKPNADAIADMAVENYIELREKVTDESFLIRKKVKDLLGLTFPSFRSRYELVSFTNIPYTEAYERGIINEKIVDELLLENVKKPEDIDLEKAKILIETLLPEKTKKTVV
eukprot:TRINITY_DN539_c0_g4_i1.p1 TRINITY_DN539_c0_g4~~TRINITY_DN539_c0_g4_i1.p1  ORF type:complete len:459 (-),score=65.85 TRINITY_DN539_c0_g4_i1:26-1402(-)